MKNIILFTLLFSTLAAFADILPAPRADALEIAIRLASEAK